MDNGRRLWWMDDPELVAIRRGVLDELERTEKRATEDDKPDPVVDDVLGGASWRELAAARDDLAHAQTRYAAAVRAARTCGLMGRDRPSARRIQTTAAPPVPHARLTRSQGSTIRSRSQPRTVDVGAIFMLS